MLEYDILKTMESFPDVWARVSGGGVENTDRAEPVHKPVISKEKGSLHNNIIKKLAHVGNYENLCLYYQGNRLADTRKMLSQENAILKRLRVEYFIESGETIEISPVQRKQPEKIRLLRELYLAEQGFRTEYAAFLEKSEDEQLSEFYIHCMKIAHEHSQILRQLITHTLG